MATDTCPKGCDLRGQPIPQEYIDKGYYGENPPTHYSRMVGVEIRGVYDGVVGWYCPDCGHKWVRLERFANHPTVLEWLEA